MEVSERTAGAPGDEWPQGEEGGEMGATRYFVRWRGRLRGPGFFGHMGGSLYELAVAEVLEIRAPRRGDCG